MARWMHDSITPTDIPPSAQLVGGYSARDPHFGWPEAGWARFPNARKVVIATRSWITGPDVNVLDVEQGDATPAEAPGWAVVQRSVGRDPTIYCSYGAWGTVQAEFSRRGIPQPHYWIAKYDGTRTLLTLNGITCVARQCAAPPSSGGHFDLSIVADYWPGVDPAPNPPPVPSTHRGGAMLGIGSPRKYGTQVLVGPFGLRPLTANEAGQSADLFPRFALDDATFEALESQAAELQAVPRTVADLSAKVDALTASVAALADKVSKLQPAPVTVQGSFPFTVSGTGDFVVGSPAPGGAA